MYSNNNNNGKEEDMIENLKTKKQKQGVTRKKEEKGKIREKNVKKYRERKEKRKRELVLQACTNRLFPSLSKILPSTKKQRKGFLQALTIQVHFPQSD